jgi:hypothetical protein
VTASGLVQPVVTFNSVDQSGDDIRSLLNTANYYTFDVICDDDAAVFICQDASTGFMISRQVIKLPLTGARLWSQNSVPAFVRLYNTGTPPASAPQIILTDAYVYVLDGDRSQPWSHKMAGMDRGMLTRADTAVQLPTWSNSAEPASLTLSNTAAGMATLGGKFQFAAVAGAATDYAIVGFQVPGSQSLFVTGVDIDAWNLGAAVATTPTVLTWGIAAGSSAVSLATATVMRMGLGAMARSRPAPVLITPVLYCSPSTSSLLNNPDRPATMVALAPGSIAAMRIPSRGTLMRSSGTPAFSRSAKVAGGVPGVPTI